MKHNSRKTLPIVSKRFFQFAAIGFFALTAYAGNLYSQQAYRLNQVIVLNDGNFLYNDTTGTYTTVGSYDPSTGIYKDFDTLRADFGSYVIIDSGYIYVGADSLLAKYDLNTKQKIATQTIQGIREMAIWGNQILVTLGTIYPLKSYFQVYDKNTLNLIYRDTTISYATQGIKVLNDSAYIAINDFGSGSVGKIGVIDLKGQKEKHEVDLGTNGLNPYDVEVQPSNQMVYTVNDLNWSNSTVTEYNATASTFNINTLNLTSGCTGSAYYLGNIYFQASNDDNIGEFSTSSLSVWDSLKINKYIYGIGIDSADGYVYIGQTDYVTYGKVFIYNLFGQAIDSFTVDVGPGNFAFDIRSATGIQQNEFSVNLSVYPNPTGDELHINYTGNYKGTATLCLTDVLGREVYQSNVDTKSSTTISLSPFASGVYFLKVQTSSGEAVKKIVKE